MSSTLNLPYVRFVRQAHTEPAANTVWRATLADAVERLKVADWRAASVGLAVETPLSEPTLSFMSDSYDTFKSSGDAVSGSGRQAAYVGMAAYRFKLPADAFDGTDASVESLLIQAYADKFNWRGLLVTAYLSDSETPSTDWSFLRAGDLATPVTVVDGLSRGILYDDAPATKTATNKTGSVSLAYATAAVPKAYLYVIVQHSDWLACKYEYWIEGAGMLVGATAAVAFDRDVTADAPDTTWAYPVNVDDLLEPSRVYPLDFLASEYNQIQKSSDFSSPVPLDLQLAVKVVGYYYSGNFSLALKSDGTVLAWGANTYNQVSGVPAGLAGVADVACKGRHCMALKSDGTVVAWGDNTYGQATIPTGLSDVVAIAAGSYHSLAVKANGTVVAWGTNGEGQTSIPSGLTGVVGIDAGENTSVAVKSDGTVSAWGRNVEGQCNVTAGLSGVTAVGCGGTFCVALKSDGTVVGWGSNNYGVHTTGLTNVVALSASRDMTLAVLSDGTMAKFGITDQTFASGTASVVSVTAGPSVSYVVARLATEAHPVLWEESVIRSAKTPAAFLATTVNDSDAQRKIVTGRAVNNSTAISSQKTDAGQFRISNAGDYFEVSAAVCGFRHAASVTDGVPNKIHISLPSLAAGAYGESYLRIILLKDTNPTAVNPIRTLANWRTVWRGGAPAGYTQLAAARIRHTGFVNSLLLPLASPGTEGVLWLCIMPLYAPLAGDSLSWDITQTGFDASRVFLLRV